MSRAPLLDSSELPIARSGEPSGGASRALRHGPYAWGEPVGQGGMAHVHIARRIGADDSKRFAAKRILPEHANKPRFVRMFRAEASISACLDHPNVVRTLDFGVQDGELVLVMEYVDGVSCAQLLRILARRGQTLPLEGALYIAREALAGLDYAHGARNSQGEPLGIIHRDVSPGNILIAMSGEVKLTDFGVARSSRRPRDTSPGALKGNFGYMSPEQIAGEEIDVRSDIFSLGVVLFELLTGRPLFRGKSDFEILARTYEANIDELSNPGLGLPLALRLVLATALARDRRERFSSAGELSEALCRFARHVGARLEGVRLASWLETLEVSPPRSRPLRFSETSEIVGFEKG